VFLVVEKVGKDLAKISCQDGGMTQPVLNRRAFPAGQMIFSEGEPGGNAYLVQSGRVDIVRDIGAADMKTLGTVTPGGLFGEMALIDDAPRMASAIAAEPTVCVVIPKATLEKKLEEADPFIVALIRIFLKNLRSATTH
jgi:CRP-like cAMP-binding protein